MPEPAQNHPDPSTLADFAIGNLPDDRAVTVADHLADCPTCVALVAKAPPDQLVGMVRAVLAENRTAPEDRGSATVSFSGAAKLGHALELPAPLRQQSKYEVLELLGAGGMGVVYKARHLVLDRLVALKVIQQNRLGDPTAGARFLREAKAISKLQHPNVVHIHDVEPLDDLIVVVMEYLEGDSLAQLIKQGQRLPWQQTCRYILEAAQGLQHAHERGLIHRDIKPDNLRLGPAGEVKVVDFGLVRSVGQAEAAQDITGSNAALGTPGYMAPEQAIDAASATVQSDLYALGCTWFCLLTGRPPFRGKSMLDTLLKHAHDDPPTLSDWRDDVPAELEALLRTLLAKDPADRPASALVVIETIQGILAGQSPTASTQAGSGRKHSSKNGGNPRRTAGLLFALGFFAAAILGAIYYLQTRDGVVRIEVLADDIEAIFTKTGATIKKADGRNDIVLSPAEDHQIRVKGGDFDFTTSNFAVKRGGLIALKVEMLPGKIQVVRGDGVVIGEKPLQKTGRPIASADRSAAEWALLMHGKIKVATAGTLRDISDVNDLPKGDLQLITIDLRGSPKVNNATFAEIAELTSLEELNLRDTQIGDTALVSLSRLPSIRTLDLTGTKITDAGLVHLKPLRHLKLLALSATKISGIGFEHLHGHSALETIYLWGTPFSDAGARQLKELPGVLTLDLRDTQITDLALEHLRHLPKLRTVQLDDNRITDDGFKALKGHQQLKGLFVDRCAKVTNAAIEHIKSLPALTHLGLKGTQVTDEGLPGFYGMKNLVGLCLRDTRVTGAAVEALAAKLPDCRIESNDKVIEPKHAPIVGAQAETPDRKAAEWVLSIGGSVRVALDGYEQVFTVGNSIPPGQLKLLGITLNWNSNITNSGLARFEGLKYLERLELAHTNVSDAGLKHLSALPLKSLALDSTSVTDEGTIHLGKLVELEYLNLGYAKLTDAGLARLNQLTHLAILAVYRTQITAKGLEQLKTLKYLSVQGGSGAPSLTTDVGIKYLAEHPRLRDIDYLIFDADHATTTGAKTLKAFSKLTFLIVEGRVPNEAISDIAQLTQLKKLDIAWSTLTGGALEHFKPLTNLVYLDLNGAQLSGLKYLKSLPKCTQLRISNVPADGDGLQCLKECPQLSFLDLGGCHAITDKALLHLKDLKNLNALLLSTGDISDAGVENLYGLTKLNWLVLRTKITETAVKKLAVRLPGCLIEWNGGTIKPASKSSGGESQGDASKIHNQAAPP